MSVASSFAILSAAQADTNWTGGVSQDWFDGANWDNLAPGNANNDAFVNIATGNIPIITSGTAISSRDVRIGTGGLNGRLDQTGGTLSTGEQSWFWHGYQGGSATYNLANTAATGGATTGFGTGTGSLNVGGTVQSGHMLVGLDAGTVSTVNVNTTGTLAAGNISLGAAGASTGTLNVDNGTVLLQFEMQIGSSMFNNGGTGNLNVSGGSVSADILSFARGSNNAAAITGTGNITGGTVSSKRWFTLGFAGSTSNVATVNNSGGTINVNTDVAGPGVLEMGVFDGTQNTFNANSGSVNLQNNAPIGFGQGGNHTGVSTFNQNGGTVTFYSDGGTTVGGTGSINLGNGGSSGTYAYNLNGGTLTVPKIQKVAAGGTGTFNFNGGLLKPTASDASFVTGLTRINVRNGGAKIDTSGFNVTMTPGLQHSNVGGDAAVDGGLTKSGAGTLAIASSSSYTGPTVVSAGTLQVAGLSATSGVSVAAGAGFTGEGTVAATVTLNGSTLGNSSATTPLTANAVNFAASGNTINVSLSSASPGIVVTGALTTGGRTATINANNTNWVNGTNTLVSFGNLSGALSNFTLGSVTGLNARQVAGSLSSTPTSLVLTVGGDSPKWTGADNGTWVIGATGANKNWRLVTAGTTTDFLNNDAVLFDDSATGTTTIDIAPATVNVASVDFNNTTKAYTFNSSAGAGIAGTASLTKNGTNSVTLNTANSYTGQTTINAGTLTLAGANTTTGATTLSGGTVNVNNATALGTGSFTIAAGGAKTINNTSGAAIVSTTNNVQAWNDDFTFTGSIDGSSDLDMGSGAVTVGGSGTNRTVTVSAGTLTVGELKAPAHGLTKNGAGTLILNSKGVNINGSNIAGTLAVNGGTVQINRTGSNGGDDFTGDLYVTGLTGTGTITNGAGQIRWVFVNQAANTSSTFGGVLDNGAGGGGLGLLKDGAGTLTLSGASTLTDRVTVANGTLAFSGSGSVVNAVEYFIGNGAGVFKVDSASRIGGFQVINITSNSAAPAPGAGSSARLELSGNTTLTNPITLAPRNDTNASDAIRNASGNNELSGLITVVTGGNQARIRSDAGLLTLSGGLTTTATGGRFVYLQGAGNGVVSGSIYDNTLDANGKINLIKQGGGTWTLSGFNTYTGNTVVNSGTLSLTQSDILADGGNVSLWAGGTLNLTTGTTDTVNSLYLNGLSVAPGVYNSSNSFGLITGTGSLNVLTYDLPGDFDNNGTVNNDDLVVWRAGMTGNNAAGDTDGDADTDGNDFLIWQRYLGATLSVPASASVPEPTALMGAIFAGVALVASQRRRSRS